MPRTGVEGADTFPYVSCATTVTVYPASFCIALPSSV